MSEFQERNKVQVARISSGSTTEQVTDYFDMRGYRRADFYLAGLVRIPSSGDLGSSAAQQFVCRVLQASDSSGGGASAISSATAVVGKNSATGFSTTQKCREGHLYFSVLDKATNLTITINGAAYQSASASTAANRFVVKEASANASVAGENFATMFNSTANNTATAVQGNWKCATEAGGWVRIVPRDRDSTHLLAIGTTGGSMVTMGGVFEAHVGVEAQFLGDGKRYVALGVKSTSHANAYTVTIVREKEQGPVVPVTYSKSMNTSTSK